MFISGCKELGDRYGALARSKLDISVDQNVQNVGSTVNSEKKDPRDFALWKRAMLRRMLGGIHLGVTVGLDGTSNAAR